MRTYLGRRELVGWAALRPRVTPTNRIRHAWVFDAGAIKHECPPCYLTESSDLADLLAGYRLDADGRTSDPALWDEWLDAVGRARLKT